MGLWAEMTDFSEYARRIPCPLCKGDSEPTLLGGHFKCGLDGHLFNEDGSPLPEGIECYCSTCKPEPVQVIPSENKNKRSSKRKKK